MSLPAYFPRVSTHPNVAMIKMTSALLFSSRDRICALVFVATSSALQDTPAVAFPVVPPVNAQLALPDRLLGQLRMAMRFGIGDAFIEQPGAHLVVALEPQPGREEALTDEPDLVLDLTLLPARCRRARLLHEGEYRGVARRLAAGLRIATATIFAPATA